MKDAPLRHAVEYAAYRAVKGVLHAAPHAWVRRFGAVLGEAAWHLDRRHRRVTLDNLALALPELAADERRRVARDCFRHFGAALCDTVSAMRFDLVAMCRRVTLEGWDHVLAAKRAAAPRGLFAMTAHFGLWEMAALAFGTYAGPLHVVGRPLDNPHLDRELVAHRRSFGNELLGKRGAARGMIRAVQKGEGVGLLIDQRVQHHEGIEVPFFGKAAWTTPVLARMSLRLGVPVVPIYALPAPGGRYRVLAKPAYAPPELPPDASDADRDAAVHTLTIRYLADMEEEIRRSPALWLWLHDRWR